MTRYLIAWFPMLLIAIGNGLLREMGFKKYFGEQAAHQLSTVTLILFFGFYIWLIIRKFPPVSATQALLVGACWLLLTLCFEFGFGRWRGAGWEELFAEYYIWKGRIWLLIPLWVAVAPYIFYRLQGTGRD